MNRLAAEPSLYLRQHAANPVDWYPWGPDALAAAKALDRPIFLSIGYSACHWCHVMEHESFEDAATAALMNAHFVCVKVDREERPDLDQIYMTAHHLLARGEGGGWPLSVFLTPDLTPFYAGTYFPPRDNYGRPSFRRVLTALADAWKTKREQTFSVGNQVAEALRAMGDLERATGDLSAAIVETAAKALRRGFDATNGGFGHAPKFPHPLEIKLLLRAARRFDDSSSLHAARLTLDKMAAGGLYDQIGGGFHRYSVDAVWLVPHFEKMLYDNALLPPAYTDAFQITGDPFYRHVARETLDYVLREMTHAGGGFFSTLDADSEGEEGKFYVWGEAEVDTILGPDLGGLAKTVYGVSEAGNFEGHNILCRSRTDAAEAKRHGLSVDDFRAKLAQVKCKLYGERSKRVWPGRDEKFLTAWNGLMIHAMATAGSVFNEPKYTTAAVRAAEFVLAKLRAPDGRLYRTCGADSPAKLPAYLEDYANLIDSLVTLYEATFEPRWLTTAGELADAMHAHFADPAGGYFFTAADHEQLIARTKDLQDGATPSGNAMAATGLLRLAAHTGRDGDRRAAEETLKTYLGLMRDNPAAAGQLLVALDWYLGPTRELVVVGVATDPETQALLHAARGVFGSARVLAYHDPASGAATLPLLKDRPAVDGRATLYVCENATCSAPLTAAAALAEARRP